jgi:hypothetical protein
MARDCPKPFPGRVVETPSISEPEEHPSPICPATQAYADVD